MACKNCGKETNGFKCDMCDAEAGSHDAQHKCGGEHCMQKCAACNQAEAKCTCPQK